MVVVTSIDESERNLRQVPVVDEELCAEATGVTVIEESCQPTSVAPDPDLGAWNLRVSTWPNVAWTAGAWFGDGYGGGHPLHVPLEAGTYVIVGGTGAAEKIMISHDGQNWAARNHGTAINDWLMGVAYSPTLKRAVTANANPGFVNGGCAYSDNAYTWVGVVTPLNEWHDICWAEDRGIFCTVGQFQSMTSPTGTVWTAHPATAPNMYCVIRVVEWGLFIAGCLKAVGEPGRIATSVDGQNWTRQTLPVGVHADEEFLDVTYSPLLDRVVMVGHHGTIIYTEDGLNWEVATAPTVENIIRRVEWFESGKMFVAVTEGLNPAPIYPLPHSSPNGFRSLHSRDGKTWYRHPTPADNKWFALANNPDFGELVAVSHDGAFRVMATSALIYPPPTFDPTVVDITITDETCP